MAESMWLKIKIAMFYGAPLAALLAASVLVVVLALRVRGGRLARKRAALLFFWAWLAPAAALLLIALGGELAGFFSSNAVHYRWDMQRVAGLLHALLPVGGGIAAAVLVLHLVLLGLLSLLPQPRKP